MSKAGRNEAGEPVDITVKELIESLLDYPMDDIVIVKKDGKELHDVTIAVRKPEGLGALFG
jgi:hypothetical protein